jgi:hypothetical protein
MNFADYFMRNGFDDQQLRVQKYRIVSQMFSVDTRKEVLTGDIEI